MPPAAGCMKESFMIYIVCRKELASPECRFVDNTSSSACTYKKGPLPVCRPGAAGWGGMVVRAGRMGRRAGAIALGGRCLCAVGGPVPVDHAGH